MPKLPKIVEALRGKVNLSDVHLIRGSFDFKGVRPGDQLNEIRFGLQATGRRSPDRPSVLQVMIGVKIIAKADGDRDLAEITCEHALNYEVSDEPLLGSFTNDEFVEFASVNGIYNAWPFVREFLSNISGRMPLPRPIVLPTLAPEMVETAEQRPWGHFAALGTPDERNGSTPAA